MTSNFKEEYVPGDTVLGVNSILPMFLTCQIKVSWIDHGLVNNLGCSLRDQMRVKSFGMQTCQPYKSFGTSFCDGRNFWALSSIQNMQISSICIEIIVQTSWTWSWTWPTGWRLHQCYLPFVFYKIASSCLASSKNP